MKRDAILKPLNRCLLLLLATLAIFAGNPAHAQPGNQEDNKVAIRLLAERGAVTGGEEIWIGTEQVIADHWHTYWKNPGDSGTPPFVEWDLPDGFEVGEIVWPTPSKLPFDPLMNYGYEDRVLLLQKLSLPDELPDGPIELTADIELLVCKVECIPEYGTYTLTLNGTDAQNEDNSAYFQQTLSTIPQQASWKSEFSEDEDSFVLNIELPAETAENIDTDTVEFFPADWGMVDNAAPAQAVIEDGVLKITQNRGERNINALKEMTGVVTFENADGEKQSHELTMTAAPVSIAEAMTEPVNSSVKIGFLGAILFALLGGIILNLMPCVFPVLSIKALSLVKIAQKHPELARSHGIAYTLGVILSFLIIAGILIALQAAGAEIGWGFQLQNPWVVGALAYLLFIIGLNLMGFFEFATPFGNLGGKFTQKEGPSGSFFTGILATLVATPCTAPFMAGALGYALVQPPIVALMVFVALGLGLALPYLVLSFAPSLQRALPKPGPWMDIFKQLLAFPMFVASLWLFWVLSQQTTIDNLSAALLGALLITFGIWLFKHLPTERFYKNLLMVIAVLSFILALGFLPMYASAPVSTNNGTTKTFSVSYSDSALKKALASGNPVFTEMTAAWCITCKVNAKVALDVPSTRKLFARNDVEYLVGDWTNEDPEITKYLQSYGRNGVPLYVFYGAPNEDTGERPEPVILPQLLTPGIVANTIEGSQ
ncbi:MAG: thioredoxin family protein [Alphaproteobacteria bacterium]|nr:thioredoxin family protein [Alphaproteobacteria bacterium]